MKKSNEQQDVAAVGIVDLPPAQVRREFKELLAAGAALLPAGEARLDPERIVAPRYLPQTRIDLFGSRYYLAAARKNPSVRFFVAFVVPAVSKARRTKIYPRIFYKDLSLVWRVASHLVANEDEFWIGKGAVEQSWRGGYQHIESRESTTDLPLEIQTALEALSHDQSKVVTDEEALFLVLRNAPSGRIEPYQDFSRPRELSAASPGGKINGGRRIARFKRRNDPASLEFVAGFEPDFAEGLVERARSSSRLYGGAIERFRFLSKNGQIQYFFFAGPRHVWIVPPQATTRSVCSYGVRVTDVFAADDLFVPGFEYHYEEEDGSWVSQIPAGFVGPQADFDPTRADASAWLDQLPIVRAFRRWKRQIDRR
jgi:hypothetical protein